MNASTSATRHLISSCSVISSSARMVSIPKNRPLRISVEGNIGSGKSTCLKYFSEIGHVETHPEPIEQWRNVNGHNLLGFLYSDLNKWNFPFQYYVYLSRLQLQTGPPSSEKYKVKMFERSLQNSHYCFTECAYRNGNLLEPEYKILTEWYNWAEKHLDINIDLIVYLKSSPEVVAERIMKRNRKEEAEIPLEYLQQVHNCYEDWLSNSEKAPCEILTINADQDLDLVLKDLQKHTNKILNLSIS